MSQATASPMPKDNLGSDCQELGIIGNHEDENRHLIGLCVRRSGKAVKHECKAFWRKKFQEEETNPMGLT